MPAQEYELVHPALDLVNTDHGRGFGFVDLLEQPAWLERFLEHWGWASAGPASARDRKALVALRDRLRRVVEALAAGALPTRRDLDELNRVLAEVWLVREVVPSGGSISARLVPAERDWRWVRSEIAASLVELVSAGDPSRLNVCDNDDCRFAFYDRSKNRSRRWCAQSVCGNRHKVREFRARRRRALER